MSKIFQRRQEMFFILFSLALLYNLVLFSKNIVLYLKKVLVSLDGTRTQKEKNLSFIPGTKYSNFG